MTTGQYHYHPNNDRTSKVIFMCPANFDMKTYLEKENDIKNLINDDRVVKLTQDLNKKNNELSKFDSSILQKIKDAETSLWNAGYTPAYIDAQIMNLRADISIDRMKIVSDYNKIQSDIRIIKEDIAQKREILLIWFEQETAFYLTCKFEKDNNIWVKTTVVETNTQVITPKITPPIVPELSQKEKEYQELKEKYIGIFTSKIWGKLKQIPESKLGKVIIQIDKLLLTNIDTKTRAKLEALKEVIESTIGNKALWNLLEWIDD